VGIWMWGEAIQIISPSGEQLAVVLIDTQGAFDSQSTYKQCTTIFALSTIVSSLQIYNVVDAIQEDALQNLTLFVKYGQLAMEHMKQFGTPFQSLCYCVRDFKAPEEYPFGKEGGRQYMEHVLTTHPGQADELRLTRDQISTSFSNLLCYLLPYPGMKVAERRSFVGGVKDLRLEFREQVRGMAESLLAPDSLQAKIINGKSVTCKKLMECFKVYVETFASTKIPMAENIVQANAILLINEAIEKAKEAYCSEMDGAWKYRSVVSEKKLERRHYRSEKAAINIYNEFPKMVLNDAKDEENRKRLKEWINFEFERYKRLNAAKKEANHGNTLLLGVGLGVGASSAVAGTALAVAAGVGTAGVAAVPVVVAGLTGAFGYAVTRRSRRRSKSCEDIPLLQRIGGSFRR
ncbi:hypothetical protein PMAYCL1PPCAC_08655, partial [Pristionchus mayeri]